MKALHDLLSHHIDDLEDVMAALKDVCDHPYALSGQVLALLAIVSSHLCSPALPAVNMRGHLVGRAQ